MNLMAFHDDVSLRSGVHVLPLGDGVSSMVHLDVNDRFDEGTWTTAEVPRLVRVHHSHLKAFSVQNYS